MIYLSALQVNVKIPLSGQELADFNEAKRLEAEREATAAAALVRTRALLEADEVESEDDSDDDSSSLGSTGDVLDADPSSGPSRAPAPGDPWDDPDGDDKRHLSFDIFVKGQSTRSTAFFRTAQGAQPRFRMFPVVEKRGRKVDRYGELVDVGVWLRKGKEIEEEAEPDYIREAKRRKVEEEEAKVKRISFVSPGAVGS